jgi:hypothetical protein
MMEAISAPPLILPFVDNAFAAVNVVGKVYVGANDRQSLEPGTVALVHYLLITHSAWSPGLDPSRTSFGTSGEHMYNKVEV